MTAATASFFQTEPSDHQCATVVTIHVFVLLLHVGKVYHLAEAGALSEAVRPLRPDGSVDTEVAARLSVRHDDSPQNVANRLALWDRQV